MSQQVVETVVQHAVAAPTVIPNENRNDPVVEHFIDFSFQD